MESLEVERSKKTQKTGKSETDIQILCSHIKRVYIYGNGMGGAGAAHATQTKALRSHVYGVANYLWSYHFYDVIYFIQYASQ